MPGERCLWRQLERPQWDFSLYPRIGLSLIGTLSTEIPCLPHYTSYIGDRADAARPPFIEGGSLRRLSFLLCLYQLSQLAFNDLQGLLYSRVVL